MEEAEEGPDRAKRWGRARARRERQGRQRRKARQRGSRHGQPCCRPATHTQPHSARVGLAAGGEERAAPTTRCRPCNHQCSPRLAGVEGGSLVAMQNDEPSPAATNNVEESPNATAPGAEATSPASVGEAATTTAPSPTRHHRWPQRFGEILI